MIGDSMVWICVVHVHEELQQEAALQNRSRFFAACLDLDVRGAPTLPPLRTRQMRKFDPRPAKLKGTIARNESYTISKESGRSEQ